MRAVLSSNIPVTRVAVFAEMAWLERRPELGVLCRGARDGGNRISIALVQSTLPGLPDAGAKNVIAWCRMLGLCDERGGLTALGEDVAESDEAPVPEQGVYDLWLAQHPVIGRRVLAVERLASKRDQRFELLVPLAFEPDRGKLFRSVVDRNERFLVRDLATNQNHAVCLVGSTNATCRLRWTLDFDQARDQWHLDGVIEGSQGSGKHVLRPIQHDPESDGVDLDNLARVWATGPLSSFGRWQASDRRLAVSFAGLTEVELDTFRKSLSLRTVEVPGKGSFKDVTLEDVPIGPASAKDAEGWAMSRFDRHLAAKPGYRSRGELRDLFVDLVEGTPLERFAPTLPSHHDLLTRAVKDPDRFWSLAAPVDLAPSPPSADDLDAFVVGSPTPEPSTSVESQSVVRVPYRGGWSMCRLVDRLLAGTIPRKVLLCDRYVCGDDNLDTLRILVAALRAAASRVTVEVWTSDEDADFKKVQAIIGTRPRSYRDVFGRAMPHDRYLLVQADHGDGFGWHMSNSPIHARADVNGASPETPLRWKDLAAARVSADELEPALRQWLRVEGRQ